MMAISPASVMTIEIDESQARPVDEDRGNHLAAPSPAGITVAVHDLAGTHLLNAVDDDRIALAQARSDGDLGALPPLPVVTRLISTLCSWSTTST